MPLVLIADDDPHIREVLAFALQKEGIRVLEAANGEEALTLARQHHPDLIILDVMMPEMDGLSMCRALRQSSDVPVLFLSSRDDELDRVLGLEMGGDDYVNKPFGLRELMARVKVLLRRRPGAPQQPLSPEQGVWRQGDLQLDAQTYQTRWREQSVVLTATEFYLLQRLMQNPQQVYTRQVLSQTEVFRDWVTERTIDSHIRRIRKKLLAVGCHSAIETVHGFGYRLGSCTS